MEYVRVTYPTDRLVYVDGEKSGRTNEVPRIDAGTHIFDLGKVNKLVVIVVNAATNPATNRDQTPDVPGLIDTVTAAATVPLDNYTFDTLEIMRATVNGSNEEARLISGCKALAAGKGAQCVPDIPAPHNRTSARVARDVAHSQYQDGRRLGVS